MHFECDEGPRGAPGWAAGRGTHRDLRAGPLLLAECGAAAGAGLPCREPQSNNYFRGSAAFSPRAFPSPPPPPPRSPSLFKSLCREWKCGRSDLAPILVTLPLPGGDHPGWTLAVPGAPGAPCRPCSSSPRSQRPTPGLSPFAFSPGEWIGARHLHLGALGTAPP